MNWSFAMAWLLTEITATQINWASVQCLPALSSCISFFKVRQHVVDQTHQKMFLEPWTLWLTWTDGKAECDFVFLLEMRLDMEEISTTAQMTGVSIRLHSSCTNCVFRYKGGDPNGLTSAVVMEKLKAKDIHLMFCRITDRTDKMIAQFARDYNDKCKFELNSKDIFGTGQVIVWSPLRWRTIECLLLGDISLWLPLHFLLGWVWVDEWTALEWSPECISYVHCEESLRSVREWSCYSYPIFKRPQIRASKTATSFRTCFGTSCSSRNTICSSTWLCFERFGWCPTWRDSCSHLYVWWMCWRLQQYNSCQNTSNPPIFAESKHAHNWIQFWRRPCTPSGENTVELKSSV